MTRLGEYLAKHRINRASLSRQTGISEPRLTRLSNKHATKLQGNELYRIALAIDKPPGDLLKFVCIDLVLKEDTVNGEKKSLSKKGKSRKTNPHAAGHSNTNDHSATP